MVLALLNPVDGLGPCRKDNEPRYAHRRTNQVMAVLEVHDHQGVSAVVAGTVLLMALLVPETRMFLEGVSNSVLEFPEVEEYEELDDVQCLTPQDLRECL